MDIQILAVIGAITVAYSVCRFLLWLVETCDEIKKEQRHG